MEYKDFERLYRRSPAAFHLGMELFLENGRDAGGRPMDRQERRGR